jgi:DNA-binding transcriptional MocR family regulator
LAPGLRLGWAVAAPDIMRKLGLLKIAADTQCSTLNMAITSLFIANYDLDVHIQRLRSHYRHKRDVMLRMMHDTFPDRITWTLPQGGLFTWVTFPQGFDATAFMRDEMLPKAAVAYVPGATFFPVTPQHNYARMNYSSQPEALIVRGVTALGQLLHQYMVKN